MLRILHELLTPPACIGCAASGPLWCDRCAGIEPSWTRRNVGVTVLSMYPFEGPVRRVIIDWKDEARADAGVRVVHWLRAAVLPLVHAHPLAVVVPVPSSPESQRRRGEAVLAAAVRRAVPEARVGQWLLARGSRRDQSGLSRSERAANLEGSMRFDGPAQSPIILVDDVVTTGATLRESVRAARAGGARPVAACTIAFREREDPFVRSLEGIRLPQDDDSGRFTWTPTTPHSNRM